MNQLTSEEETQEKKQNHGLVWGLAITAVVVICYAVGWIYFSSHYYPKTTIGELSVGGKTVQQADQDLEALYRNYDLTLTGYVNRTELVGEEEGAPVYKTVEYHLKDLNLEYDAAAGDANSSFLMDSQEPYFWPVRIFQSFHGEPTVHMDEAKIKKKIRKLECFHNPDVSEDARIVWENGAYQVVAEVYGTELKKSVNKDILNAVKEGQEAFDLVPYYIDPEITKENETLLAHQKEMQEMANLDLYYQFGEQKETLPADVIASMLTQDQEGVYVDEEQVRAYVKELSDQYDTAYSPHTFTTHYGSTITISSGDYGWWTDVTSSTETLKAAIEQKQPGEQKFTYFQTAAAYGERDYGDTYVEVSLGSQSLWCYVNGEVVVSCNIISGKVTSGHSTPRGIYSITYKETGHQMVGEDYDVWTDYWMPFNGNVGLHDASWRSSFGGNIYVNNGSHGCVNMPVWAAKAVFGYVQKGTPVIVY